MCSVHFAHRVLVLPVIGEPELRHIGGTTKGAGAGGSGQTGNGVIGKIEVETIQCHRDKIKADASVIEAKFVGPAWADHVGVAESTVQRDGIESTIKSRKII